MTFYSKKQTNKCFKQQTMAGPLSFLTKKSIPVVYKENTKTAQNPWIFDSTYKNNV